MPTFPDHKLALSNSNLPDMRIWQAAIDSWGFLLPITLKEVGLGSSSSSMMEIAVRQCRFTCDRIEVAGVVENSHPELGKLYEIAYAFGGQGELASSVAAAIAAVSYATATHGVFYDPEIGPAHDHPLIRQGLDLGIATCCDDFRAFEARYPSADSDTWGEGPLTMSSSLV